MNYQQQGETLVQIDTILANRYQIQSQLSQKAGRRTFLALDNQSQDLVIIKLLRFDADFQWDDLKLFEREADTLKHLHHSAIPQYLDYFEVEEMGDFALVQTYIDAPSLETAVKQGRKFSADEVRELADRLLSILTYLHSQHPPIIHRDIKPSNILLTNRSGNSIGDVYLVDFGSVQTVASKDGGTITIVGSYGYIPLEQFGGQTTMASDLYSLGMTLIYLLTGTHPAQLNQVNGQVKFTAEIDNSFKRWLEKMTQPHLDKRFDSARLAQIALNSKDESYGDFNHLKPANAQVKLYRDRDRLEIRWQDIDRERIARIDRIVAIPPKLVGWMFLITFISFFCINPVLVAIGYNFFLPLSLIPFGSLFVTAFILIPIAYFLGAIFKCFMPLVDYSLTIDREFVYRSKSRSPSHKPIILSQHLRSRIETLAYNPGYTFDKYLDNRGTVISRGQVTIPPKLYLYCGDFEYSPNDRSSQAELWWLGQELSEFLNLELQVIYPTPQVPPAPSCGGGC
jgi:serine/threonine protein kinase